MFSLDDAFIDAVLGNTVPSFQLTCRDTRNLGLGGLFYSFARALRPKHAVAIGSKAGFAPIMFARALKDNQGYGIGTIDCEATELVHAGEKPTLHFVDPSYSLHREDENHWYGLGTWDDPEKVIELWKKFGVEDIATHFKMTSAEYLANRPEEEKIDLLYVDGDHSYKGMMHDFMRFFSRLSRNAMVLAHDVDPEFTLGDGYKVFNDLPDDMYEKVRIPIYPGLAIMRKKETDRKNFDPNQFTL